MGGRIGVQSEPGQGSTFWFEIPLLKVIGDVQIRQTAHDARRVLAITPNLRQRQRIALLLPNWGMSVSIVETTGRRWNACASRPPLGQPASFVAVVADYDGLRHSARALHRALTRTPAYANVRLLWLYGDEEIAEDLREGTSMLPRLAPDTDLRSALLEPLPAAEVASSAPEPAPVALPAPEPTPSEPAHPMPPSRLLLVEDNPVNLLVAQKLLSVLGYECDTASNGEVALSHMASGSYDLVLMDCQMPVLDGYSATRRWREHEAAQAPGRRLPIVAMTANAMAGDRQRCLDAGMDDYLSKPVAREQLEACLRRWLRTAPARSAAPRPPEPSLDAGDTPPAPISEPDVPAAATIAAPAVPASVTGAAAAGPAPVTAGPTVPAVSIEPDMPIFVPAATAAPATEAPAIEDAPSSQLPPPPVLEPEMLDELREIAGDEALTIVNLFLEDAPRLVRLMEQASAIPDMEMMREAAHALKSSSANVGALALSAAAKRIELGARARALDRPAVAVALLIAEFARARVALQGWLSTASAAQSSSLLSR